MERKMVKLGTRVSMMGLALALAACDSDGGDTAKTKSIKAANPHVDQLKSLSEYNRGMGLRRAARDSGQRCKKAESSGYQEDYKNLSMWTLRCTDGDYAIFIAPTGDVQVRQCRQLKQLDLPECRFPPAQAGGREPAAGAGAARKTS
jgi:hypothetical protein